MTQRQLSQPRFFPVVEFQPDGASERLYWKPQRSMYDTAARADGLWYWMIDRLHAYILERGYDPAAGTWTGQLITE